tara:strand:- start:788 stop:1084 length:297 start_codon:yes stop_codon:yes gene_type:complete
MSNFIEIGGLIKKGLGHSVVERFSKNIDVVSIGYANGRSSDLFDFHQFGDASEAEILTMIVKERKSNAIFDELHSFLKLSSESNGVIYKFDPISKIKM